LKGRRELCRRIVEQGQTWAERFIRTMVDGWAYGAIYRDSTERTRALKGSIRCYNHQRRHSALGHQTPVARLTPSEPTHSVLTTRRRHLAY